MYDYTKGLIHEQLKQDKIVYDAIIDCIGDTTGVWDHCESYLREGGVFAAAANGVEGYSGIPGALGRSLSAKFLPGWLGGVGGGRIKK